MVYFNGLSFLGCVVLAVSHSSAARRSPSRRDLHDAKAPQSAHKTTRLSRGTCTFCVIVSSMLYTYVITVDKSYDCCCICAVSAGLYCQSYMYRL